MRKFKLGVLFLGLVLAAACQKKNDNIANGIYSDLPKDPAKIFSNRPTSYGKFVALFKLRTPSLFEALKTEQLKQIVDKELQTAIETEQKAFIESLKSINSEIIVIMKYKYLLNGVAALVSVEDYNKISKLSTIGSAEVAKSFAKPQLAEGQTESAGTNLALNNSALFIGSKYAMDKNIKGQGMRVGIIDTGIDYTHAMLGGKGVEEEYKSIDPSLKSSLFPNSKVVGGYDFVGTNYSSTSIVIENRIPKPDENPLDELGHGTHVAGTVAGIGDGVNSYDGIAPEAQLYALKVFGREGSTSDEIVIAALEYSADPNGDGNIDDRLDVVNLSLGSNFGAPRNLYRLAIKNLTLGGTVVVASAGNSGDTSYIVGAPGISDEALSVAASIDGMDHNWKFRVIEFFSKSAALAVEFVEGAVSKKISELKESKDKLVYIGLADKPLTPEQIAILKGNVAVIDRGGNPFIEKMKLAEAAGAVGVVMINNQEGAPIIMGGEGTISIPAVMITQEVGESIKQALLKGEEVFVQFKSNKKIEKPNLIDTLTSFSSRGPRSEDSLIKPEITAPGQQIISALMGKGKLTVPMSGTSMSGPHMTGVMALVKQFFPELNATELKSVVMGTAINIQDEKKQIYPVSRMGAGRVRIDKALGALVAASPASLSLGEVRIESQKVIYKEINIRNLRPELVSFNIKFSGHAALSINETNVTMDPKGSGKLGLKIAIDASKIKNAIEEIDGFVQLIQGEEIIFRLPVLAVVRKVSDLAALGLKIHSTSVADSDGAMVELNLKNNSIQKAVAVPLNLIALDNRKYANPGDETNTSKACDIQAVGYKIVAGKIYFGFKLFQPVTTWHACELSVLFDTDEDGIADQELAGVSMSSLEGLPMRDQFISVLLDAKIARMIRMEYEASVVLQKPVPLTYIKAVEDALPMIPLNHSTVAMVVADIAKIRAQKSGLVSFKIASTSGEKYNVEEDDFLENDEKDWRKLDLTELGQSFIFSDLAVQMDPKSQKTVTFTKGHGKNGLMLLMPSNRSLSNSVTLDEQLDIVKPSFLNQGLVQ